MSIIKFPNVLLSKPLKTLLASTLAKFPLNFQFFFNFQSIINTLQEAVTPAAWITTISPRIKWKMLNTTTPPPTPKTITRAARVQDRECKDQNERSLWAIVQRATVCGDENPRPLSRVKVPQIYENIFCLWYLPVRFTKFKKKTNNFKTQTNKSSDPCSSESPCEYS